MNRLYELFNVCWKTAKKMIEKPVEDNDDFKQLIKLSEEAIKSIENVREQKFVKAVILAVFDYIEDNWRERNERNR